MLHITTIEVCNCRNYVKIYLLEMFLTFVYSNGILLMVGHQIIRMFVMWYLNIKR